MLKFPRVLLVASLLTLRASSYLTAQVTSCMNGPYTACIDSVPATYLSGSWIEDDDASEWTLIGNNAGFGVSGTVGPWLPYVSVYVFNPEPECPVVEYSLGPSSYLPSPLSSQEGSTQLTWVAESPNPSGECGGWTPVPKQTFSTQYNGQALFNKGNDTATVQYSNNEGTGSTNLETNLILTPTSETLSANTKYNSNGFGPPGNSAPLLFVVQTLVDTSEYDPPDPNGNKFAGRQVYEAAGSGTQSDNCYTEAMAHGYTNPGGPFLIQGAVWNVGALFIDAQNDYGSDQIGFTAPTIAKYRTYLAGLLPCTATVSQAMYIVNDIPGYQNQQFATHTLKITLNAQSEVVSKDGLTSTYPH